MFLFLFTINLVYRLKFDLKALLIQTVFRFIIGIKT